MSLEAKYFANLPLSPLLEQRVVEYTPLPAEQNEDLMVVLEALQQVIETPQRGQTTFQVDQHGYTHHFTETFSLNNNQDRVPAELRFQVSNQLEQLPQGNAYEVINVQFEYFSTDQKLAHTTFLILLDDDNYAKMSINNNMLDEHTDFSEASSFEAESLFNDLCYIEELRTYNNMTA